MFDFNIPKMLMTVPGILIGFTVHEFAHAYAAYRLGDETAKQDGRLTLNPMRHIDPIGFLLLMTAGFGWAKPVLFNPEALRNPKRDEILISLAGPFSNLILAFLSFGVVKLAIPFLPHPVPEILKNAVDIVVTGGFVNLGLCVFNMLPIPPLDGSHLYMVFLREKNWNLAQQLSRFGMVALLIVIVVENHSGLDILPIGKCVDFLASGMLRVLGLA